MLTLSASLALRLQGSFSIPRAAAVVVSGTKALQVTYGSTRSETAGTAAMTSVLARRAA